MSALDVEGEIAVQSAIARLAAGRTTLLIAHRLPATLRADHIVVLEEGRVVEQGKPAELHRRLDSRYRQMIRLWQGEIETGVHDEAPPSGVRLWPTLARSG